MSHLAEEADLLRAAGGIVWVAGASGRRLAVIHRKRQGDWTLPKGKLENGETFEEAAVREVTEETGCQVQLGDFAGASVYDSRGGAKIVLYWHMTVVRERPLVGSEEVDRVAWLTPAEALHRLHSDRDRQLLRAALAGC